MRKSIEEFKAFINKGNAVDLAVGLVMGTAFNNIIKSLVTHIITPFISLLGGTSLAQLFILLRGTATYDELSGIYVFSENAIVLEYGLFITSVVDFFIIAIALFLTLKLLVYLNQSVKKVSIVKKDKAVK
jgi:large conductance mechanosensitive channel